jgi:hypothetical protein
MWVNPGGSGFFFCATTLGRLFGQLPVVTTNWLSYLHPSNEIPGLTNLETTDSSGKSAPPDTSNMGDKKISTGYEAAVAVEYKRRQHRQGTLTGKLLYIATWVFAYLSFVALCLLILNRFGKR